MYSMCVRNADLVQQAQDLGEDSGALAGVDDIVVECSSLEEGREGGREEGREGVGRV